MRFDDSLDTVLAGDMTTPFGAQSGWRQLVDLIGRGRAPASDAAIDRLRDIRPLVPAEIRSASARALAFTRPPAALVALFADDNLSIAAPVIRIAQLHEDEWAAILPTMAPTGRSLLRHRRDLAPGVMRALETFGPTDFVLAQGDDVDLSADSAVALAFYWTEVVPADAPVVPDLVAQEVPPLPEVSPVPSPKPLSSAVEALEQAIASQPLPGSSFVSLASVAFGLPVVTEAMRLRDAVAAAAQDLPDPEHEADLEPEVGTGADDELSEFASPPAEPAPGPFQISDLVARIEAYQAQRDLVPVSFADEAADAVDAPVAAASPAADAFCYETDGDGTICWVSGIARETVIGLALAPLALRDPAKVDGGVASAIRRRTAFADGRLLIEGQSQAAGAWQISGVPAFDRATGRFTGYRGSARRPRIDERAEPLPRARNGAADSLRQLVHELRTPTTAIAGFAEMIESELLGPVAVRYRDYAGTIRESAAALLSAIDDLDTAARIETHALDLRPTKVDLRPLIDRTVADLAPLCALRGARITVDAPTTIDVRGDDRAIDRLIARLMAALVSAAGKGEVIGIGLIALDDVVVITVDRPYALAAYPEETLLAIDAEREAAQGAPLLGTGFALRLARNLAIELGGTLTIGRDHLTLRLPAALSAGVGQASIN